MKKTNLIRCLKVLVLLISVLAFVLFSQEYLFYFSDHNTDRIRRFYQEEENSLDVVFLGSSDVFSGFAPARAYEETGVTSYMYAIDANPGRLHKYQLKEVLRKQQPQLIFVEVNGFLYDQPVEEERLRIFTENTPFSLNELEAIMRFKEEDKLAGLFPFMIYHGDWEKGRGLLDQLEWRIATSRNPSLLKGIITCTHIDEALPEEVELSEAQKATMQVAEESLDEFLTFCKEENLNNIVFVRFPHKTGEQQKELINQVENRVLEFGYPFLNLETNKDAMGLDPLRDYYNPEHLNIYGQAKLTSYVGNLIVQEYGVVPVPQSAENSAHWENCVAYYHLFYDYAHELITQKVEVWPCEDNLTFEDFLEWVESRPA